MNITVLTGSVPSTTFIDAQVNAMAEDGFDITIIGKKTGAFKYHQNVTVIVIPERVFAKVLFIIRLLLATGFRHFVGIVKSSRGIMQLYNDLLFYLPIIYSKPDRIHVQWAAFIHNRDLLFDLYPHKILVSLRGAHINYTPITTPEIKESYMRLFPRVHRFHAVSKAIANEAAQYGARPEATNIIYSFVDDKLLQKEIQPKTPHPELRIISVGRFFWKKGYEYALDALGMLKREGIPFTYTLIAEGKTPASIQYQLHQQDINDEVHIVNGLPHNDVLKEIEKHDVLLLPSVEEGIANAVLEAMASGTPVISTGVGGIAEVIQRGKSGYVVPARDIHALKEALSNLYSLNKEQRFAMATEAKKIVVEQHNRQAFVDSFRKFYNY